YFRCKQIAIGYNERGFMKYQKVDFDEAIADYSKALSYDSSLYFTYYNRGLIHYRLGRFEEAISDLKEALSIEPDFEPAKQCLKQAKVDKQSKAEHDQEQKPLPETKDAFKGPLSSQDEHVT
ncbi:tetratricopeptide repeat protein 32-like, partial [Ruditapes philippinarum]|uniref:tetratricopeptide repeat protein 32-like n=1 Tax=Ruditapes philippinarum TaxID=129788 RepID=UPI00295AF616